MTLKVNNPTHSPVAAGISASGAPLRTAFVYFPNGAIQKDWWPESSGEDKEFKLSKTLAPLESVKDSLQLLEGLDMAPANAGADGAGDHARSNGTFLTGVRLNKSATNIRAGVSIDRSSVCSQIGQSNKVPFAGVDLRNEPKNRRVRLGIQLRLSVQSRVAVSSDTDDP